MAAGMTPMELVGLLNQVFLCFDGLVEKYDLEKIKTIGDCYMVASGVPRSRSDHATGTCRPRARYAGCRRGHKFGGASSLSASASTPVRW